MNKIKWTLGSLQPKLPLHPYTMEQKSFPLTVFVLFPNRCRSSRSGDVIQQVLARVNNDQLAHQCKSAPNPQIHIIDNAFTQSWASI